jgi:hypothetical protein
VQRAESERPRGTRKDDDEKEVVWDEACGDDEEEEEEEEVEEEDEQSDKDGHDGDGVDDGGGDEEETVCQLCRARTQCGNAPARERPSLSRLGAESRANVAQNITSVSVFVSHCSHCSHSHCSLGVLLCLSLSHCLSINPLDVCCRCVLSCSVLLSCLFFGSIPQ